MPALQAPVQQNRLHVSVVGLRITSDSGALSFPSRQEVWNGGGPYFDVGGPAPKETPRALGRPRSNVNELSFSVSLFVSLSL